MNVSQHRFYQFIQRFQKIEQTLQVNNSTLLFQRDHHHHELPLSSIDKLLIKKGWFFSRLVITTADNKTFIIKGYSNSVLTAFKSEVSAYIVATIAKSDYWQAFQHLLSTIRQKQCYLSRYEWSDITKLAQLSARLRQLGIQPSAFAQKYQQDILLLANELSPENVSESARIAHNQRVVPELLTKYQAFFDGIEKMPLTEQQRVACVTNDDHSLVIAGAGSGKTATLVSKAAYLVASKLAQPNNILMLAFGNKAAVEMNERIAAQLPTLAPQLHAQTFHGLGKEVINAGLAQSLAVSDFSQSAHAVTEFLSKVVMNLAQENKSYQTTLLHYLCLYSVPAKSSLSFNTISDYQQFLAQHRLLSKKQQRVNNVGELYIANFLALYQINYHIKKVASQCYFYLPDTGTNIAFFDVNSQLEPAPYLEQPSIAQQLSSFQLTDNDKSAQLICLYGYQLIAGELISCLTEQLNAQGIAINKTVPACSLTLLKQHYSREFHGFITVMQTFLSLFKEANYTVDSLAKPLAEQGYDVLRTTHFLTLFSPIYSHYQQHLTLNEAIDFSDMIAKATTLIQQSKFSHEYHYILVDEFQDISKGRQQLLTALLNSKPNMRLFAVGDDWQSIYRFNGADIKVFTLFAQYFSPATTVTLDKSFRFNNKIHALSHRFIDKNPAQIKKYINTHVQLASPACRVVDVATEYSHSDKTNTEPAKTLAYQKVLHRALNTLNSSVWRKNKRATVLVIGRYSLTKMQMLANITFSSHSYNALDIDYVTAHASKGLEADHVIVVGVNIGHFPATKANDEVLDLVLARAEPYLYAEERRLFYVALTRAKHFIYLLFDSTQQSPFIDEILQDNQQTTAENRLIEFNH